jgi:hypothetical protein
MKISIGSSSEKGTGCAGKGFGTIFFGVFFLMGALFTILILGEVWKQLAPWWWPATSCTILSSGVVETSNDEDPYRPVVRYRYDVAGRTHESDRFFRSDGGTSSYDRARDQAARYRPGDTANCRVSPSHPALAVLERTIPWIVFVVPLPLIFVAIGGGGLWAMWLTPSSENDGSIESISQTAVSGRGHRFMIGFGLLFVVIGVAVFTPMSLIPSVRLAVSQTWSATPCDIVDSRLRSWSTDDGTSYRADVLYLYLAGGREWRSNRVDFFSFLSSGPSNAREIVDRYPVGSSTTCWVDPRDPSRSVLDRHVRPQQLFGLLPLLFVFAGWAVANYGWKKATALRNTHQTASPPPDLAEGPLFLEPQVGPGGKVSGAVFFALFWNGIVSVFVWQTWKSWESGSPDWFLTVFLIPFVLVGFALVGLVGSTVLALANPRPRVTVTSGRPRLGEALHLEWQFTGRSARLNRLRIFLEGREEATYRRGTDTITDTEVFATFDLVTTRNDWEIPRGSVELTIPADTMHSFEAVSNKIIWEIKVEGAIDRWPDVNQNFPIQVQPMRSESP